jgi:hypothetical protein
VRGEKNLEILLTERPADKAGLTTWKGGIAFKRAIDGCETKHTDDFEREYRKALDLYAEAARLDLADAGVMAKRVAAEKQESKRHIPWRNMSPRALPGIKPMKLKYPL